MPATVEMVLREATGVGDVRVYGKGSSLVGQLVAADIVLARGSDETAVRAEINRIARGGLPARSAASPARGGIHRAQRCDEGRAVGGGMKGDGVALISGGSRGLGLAMVKSLLDQGSRVATFSRRPESQSSG